MKSNLNEKQKEAVYLDFGPALILAGPGSGKTTVILERLKHLIYDLHISPKHILVITFTKSAALQMQNRAFKMLNDLSESPIFGTFHSFFYSILKNTYEFQNYSILTTKQKYQNLEKLLHIKYKKDKLSNNLLAQIIACISKSKNDIDVSEELIKFDFSKEIWIELCKNYDYFNREQKQMDYDDILLYAHKLLTDNSDLLHKLQKEIKYILVDEFQDVNKKQYELITMLAEKRGNIFVVGDDDQSIYCFRGARAENLFRFEADFPTTKKIILGKNYRCSKKIVKVSGALISHNEKRFQKELVAVKDMVGEVICRKFFNKNLEREFIVSTIKKLLYNDKEIAILCRTNSQLDYFGEILKSQEIKFFRYEKSTNFYQSSFVKPIIGYLMFASFIDRSRKTLLSFLNKPMRYIEREVFANWDLCKCDILQMKTGNESMDLSLCQLSETLDRIAKLPPKMAILYILKVVGYEEFVLRQCKSWQEVNKFYDTMKELSQRADTYENIRQWMKYIKWQEDMEVEKPKRETNFGVNLYLYTFHGAKGLEFDTVLIPHLNEGSIPYGKNLSKEQIEEERRMFYVALTRAKENLYLTCVENDTKKDTVSRFLNECKLTASK